MKPEEDFYQLLDSDDHESKHNSLNRQSMYIVGVCAVWVGVP